MTEMTPNPLGNRSYGPYKYAAITSLIKILTVAMTVIISRNAMGEKQKGFCFTFLGAFPSTNKIAVCCRHHRF